MKEKLFLSVKSFYGDNNCFVKLYRGNEEKIDHSLRTIKKNNK